MGRYAYFVQLGLLLVGSLFASPARAQFCQTCIQNQAALQPGAQFHVSSGSVDGNLTVNNVIAQTLNISALTAGTFTGDGSHLTILNAAQLSSGTVPSARLSGTYSGITGIGALTSGTWNGTIIGTQYGGTGQNFVTVGAGAIPYFSNTGVMTTLQSPSFISVLESTGTGGTPVWVSSPSLNGSNFHDIKLTSLLAGNLPTNIAVGDASLSTVSAAKVYGNISGGASFLTVALPVGNLAGGTLPTSNAASSITVNGVTAGTYGGPSTLAQLQIGTDGRVYSAAQFNLPGAGVSTGVVTNATLLGDGNSASLLRVNPSSVPILNVSGYVPNSQIDPSLFSGKASSGANADITSLSALTSITSVVMVTSSMTNTSAGGLLVRSSVTAGAFYGDGSHLTGITATNIPNTITSSQTFKASVLISNSDLLLTGSSGVILTGSSVTAGAFYGNGAGLTSVTGIDSSKLPLIGGTLTGPLAITNASLTLSGPNGYITSGSSITGGSFYGDGSHLTGVSASLPNTITSSFTITGSGGLLVHSSATAGAFFGDGSHLTGIATSSTVYVNASLSGDGSLSLPLGVKSSSVAVLNASGFVLNSQLDPSSVTKQGFVSLANLSGAVPSGRVDFSTITAALSSTTVGNITSCPGGAFPHDHGAFDGQNLWFTDYGSSSLTKITQDCVVTNYPLGIASINGGIAYDGSAMWVAGTGVTKISSAGVIVAQYSPGGSAFTSIAYDGAYMWATRDATFVKFAQDGSSVTYTNNGVTGGLTFDGVNMWATNGSVTEITKITPEGVITNFAAGASASGLVFDGTYMWAPRTIEATIRRYDSQGNFTSYPITAGSYGQMGFDGTNVWLMRTDAIVSIAPQGTTNAEYTGITYTTDSDVIFDGSKMWIANAGSSTVKRIYTGMPTADINKFPANFALTIGAGKTTVVSGVMVRGTAAYGQVLQGSSASSATWTTLNLANTTGAVPSGRVDFSTITAALAGKLSNTSAVPNGLIDLSTVTAALATKLDLTTFGVYGTTVTAAIATKANKGLNSDIYGHTLALTDSSSMTNTSAGGILAYSSITASAFFGDGSHLTGITGGSITADSTVTWTAPHVFADANVLIGAPFDPSLNQYPLRVGGSILLSSSSFEPVPNLLWVEGASGGASLSYDYTVQALNIFSPKSISINQNTTGTVLYISSSGFNGIGNNFGVGSQEPTAKWDIDGDLLIGEELDPNLLSSELRMHGQLIISSNTNGNQLIGFAKGNIVPGTLAFQQADNAFELVASEPSSSPANPSTVLATDNGQIWIDGPTGNTSLHDVSGGYGPLPSSARLAVDRDALIGPEELPVNYSNYAVRVNGGIVLSSSAAVGDPQVSFSYGENVPGATIRYTGGSNALEIFGETGKSIVLEANNSNTGNLSVDGTNGYVGLGDYFPGVRSPTTRLSVDGVITSSTTQGSVACNAGTPVLAATATDQHGSYTAGTLATACTYTFATPFPKDPDCFCNSSSATLPLSATHSANDVTCTGASSLTGITVSYFCFGAP